MLSQNEKEIEEFDKIIQEEQRVANDENEEPFVRERAREKIKEKTEKKNELVKEREQLREQLSLRERVKEIFKKYGFTVTAVLLAVGTTIGVGQHSFEISIFI